MNTFDSKDIPLVAYLHTLGHKIQSVTTARDNLKRVSFIFSETKKLIEDLYNYQRNESIPVQDYYRSLSYVWTLIKKNSGGRYEKNSM